jgi:hypothetical protein
MVNNDTNKTLDEKEISRKLDELLSKLKKTSDNYSDDGKKFE